MGPRVSPMTNHKPTNELPAHASVFVISGGVMDCSTLYHLVKAGVSDAVRSPDA